MTTLAIAGIALLFSFVAYVAFTSAQRMMRDRGTLQLYRLAEARGLELLPSSSELDLRAAAQAARRCAGCASQERCDAYLQNRDYGGLRDICPNTPFLDRLAR
jgi:hypothetical protein